LSVICVGWLACALKNKIKIKSLKTKKV